MTKNGKLREDGRLERDMYLFQVKTPAESKSKDDRGVVHVETKGMNQDGVLVCVFRRKVMVPKRVYAERTGGEFPGRPELREQ